MTFDLRSKYAFDATEGQIPEGNVSVYGPANSHANCVPASFTAALALAGYPDIDPQLVTNEVYGPNYRGGFGNFTKCIAWIQANVQNPPALTDGPFDFNVADAAGQAGQLIIVAGWINAASVTFTAQSNANGFSHASLLVGHLANDQFVIWNTWTGQIQTYSRAVLAASLYEMSVMTSGQFSGGSGSLGGEDVMTPAQEAKLDQLQAYAYQLGTAIKTLTDYSYQLGTAIAAVKADVDAIKTGSGSAPLTTITLSGKLS